MKNHNKKYPEKNPHPRPEITQESIRASHPELWAKLERKAEKIISQQNEQANMTKNEPESTMKKEKHRMFLQNYKNIAGKTVKDSVFEVKPGGSLQCGRYKIIFTDGSEIEVQDIEESEMIEKQIRNKFHDLWTRTEYTAGAGKKDWQELESFLRMRGLEI